LFSYAGNKSFLKNTINMMIPNSTESYSELFLGSGGIYRNLNKENIKEYILNDLDSNIFKIWCSFFELKVYSELLYYRDKIYKDFGNIKKSKESFYKFRTWYNENSWKKDTIESGIYLYFLFNSCMNGMARFGPNGFNQSFGGTNRFALTTKENFNNFKEKQKFTKLYNKNYKELIQDSVKDNNVLFLDPPYYSQEISYTYGFNLNKHLEFLEIIKSLKCKVIYTDILNEYNSSYLKDWNIINIRKIQSIAPIRKTNTENKEVIFYNFEYQERNNFKQFFKTKENIN